MMHNDEVAKATPTKSFINVLLWWGLILPPVIMMSIHPALVVTASSPGYNNPKPPGYSKLVKSMLQQSEHHAEEIETTGHDRVGRALNEGRSLYDQKTQKIRITFETSPIEKTLSSLKDESLVNLGRNVIDQILPSIRNQFEEAISIQPYSGMFLSRTICFDIFTEYFNERRKRYPDTDVVVFVSAMNEVNGYEWCSGTSEGTLAGAAPCSISRDDDRPNVGFVNICLKAVQDKISRLEDISDVMSHEILHILILSTDLFKLYRNGIDGTPLTERNGFGAFDLGIVQCVDGELRSGYPVCPNTLALRQEEIAMNGIMEKRPYYEITLPTVRQVVRNQFNCQSLTGARLENQPTNPDDCTGSHFDERFFFSNVMSAFYIFGSVHFSPLLLALMEDSGWYKSNYRLAENGSFGLNAGCDFYNKDCIVNGNLPNYSEGYFCNDFSSQYHCGPTMNYRGRCDLSRMTLSDKRTYFDSILAGPMSFVHADWCPLVYLDRQFCSEDTTCFEVSVNSRPTALCVESFCEYESEQFIFKVGNSFYYCNPEDKGSKQKISWNGDNYEFVCPNLNQVCPDMFCPAMCSGKGICNWDADPKPVCECFDSNDTTAGCFDSSIRQPAKCYENSLIETSIPSVNPTPKQSSFPSSAPSHFLSAQPTTTPTMSVNPSNSIEPTFSPSQLPNLSPSFTPSEEQTNHPSISSAPTQTTVPSFKPTSTKASPSPTINERQHIIVTLSRSSSLQYSPLLCTITSILIVILNFI